MATTLNRYGAALKALAALGPEHCIECGRRATPGEFTCARHGEPRMRRTRDRAGGYQAIAAATDRLG